MSKPSLQKNKIALIYAGWWMVWFFDQSLVLVQIGFPWSIALIDAAVTQLVLAVAGYTINTSMHSYQPSQKNSFYVFTWSIALAALCVFLQRWALSQWLGEVAGYNLFLENSLVVRGAFAWLMIMLIAVLTWTWVYVSERHESEKRKQDSERLAREAELSSLRLQLQPHFLFNSLNSISALVGTQPELARTMIHQLSDFLRGTIGKDNQQLITLAEELKHLELYLAIEKVRFGHRLTSIIEHDEKGLTMKLPALLLQPIVENAIKFGLYDHVGDITISINVKTENEKLIIEVRNPFDAITSQPRKGTGFGLNSIQRRLYLLYAQNDLLTTQTENTTFITILKIPQSI
jgi:two-component system, LytTR family, sensor kinase